MFNLFTGTPWQGAHRTPAEILLILRGFAQGVTTARLTRELGASRPHLLELRHQVQARSAAATAGPLPDDECRTPTHSTRRGGGLERFLIDCIA